MASSTGGPPQSGNASARPAEGDRASAPPSPSASPSCSRASRGGAAAGRRRAPPTSRRTTPAITPTPRWSPRSWPRRPPTRTSSQVRSIGKSYQGRDIWVAKIVRQRGDRRERARGHVRFDPSRPGAPVARAGPRDPALADHGYGTDSRITNIVNTREIWIVFAVNPDGAEYDLTGSPVPLVAQEPPAERRDQRRSARTSTGTTATTGRAAAGRRHRKSSLTYHGSAAFSTPEARVIRDFMASRRIGGRQQIRTAITFHTAGQQILWPYGYTKTDVPGDMTPRITPRWSRSASRWPPRTATRPCSRAACTSPTVTRSTGRTATKRIFMYTFELYPSHSQVSSDARFYPPDEHDRAADRAEQGRRS